MNRTLLDVGVGGNEHNRSGGSAVFAYIWPSVDGAPAGTPITRIGSVVQTACARACSAVYRVFHQMLPSSRAPRKVVNLPPCVISSPVAASRNGVRPRMTCWAAHQIARRLNSENNLRRMHIVVGRRCARDPQWADLLPCLP